MPEKTCDMIYDAIMDLTKAVNNLRAVITDLHADMNTRFDHLESDIDFVKLKQFDNEKKLKYLKHRA